MASIFALGLLFVCCKTVKKGGDRVAYTSSPGWLQTQRPQGGGGGGEQARGNNNVNNTPNRRNRSHTPSATPSAPPAANVYSIPDADASADKPPDVSFNPPTYEEATTGNVYWNPSAPDIAAADKKY